MGDLDFQQVKKECLDYNAEFLELHESDPLIAGWLHDELARHIHAARKKAGIDLFAEPVLADFLLSGGTVPEGGQFQVLDYKDPEFQLLGPEGFIQYLREQMAFILRQLPASSTESLECVSRTPAALPRESEALGV